MTLDLGVLISGRGSNLQAILDAIAAGQLDAKVHLVVSNKPGAAGLDRARAAGIPTAVITQAEHPTREAYDAAVVDALRGCGVTCVVLAGFMRLVTSVLLDAFPDRVLNIHPSLLPAFPGLHAQAQALRYGVKLTGCTVHLVDVGLDTGPILDQRAVPVRDDDTEETLSARILKEEHALLVAALRKLAANNYEVLRPSASDAEPHRAPQGRVRVRERGSAG